jgi:hypothetical protein
MIYDAGTPALPREGRGVKHACFIDERVARDLVVFESRPVRFPLHDAQLGDATE